MSELNSTYVPGGWVAVAGPAAWLLADVDPNSALADELYEAVTSGASVADLSGHRLGELTSFALAGPGAEGELRVLVRGNASAVVADAGGERTVIADGSGPWTEQRVTGAGRIVLGRGTEPSTTGTPWRLRVGMAAADAVIVSAAGSTPEPGPGPTPIPEPGPTPIPEPGPTPIPEPGPTPIPEPGPTPIPEPGPTPIPEPGPTPIPEPGPAVPPPAPMPVPPPLPSPTFSAAPVPEPVPSPVAEAAAAGTPAGSSGHQPVRTAGQGLVLGQEPWRARADPAGARPPAGPELGEWGDPVLSRPPTPPPGPGRPNDFTSAPYGEDDFDRPGGVIGAPTGTYRGADEPPLSNVIGARSVPVPAPAGPELVPPAPQVAAAPAAPANPLGWEPVQESTPEYDTLHPRPEVPDGPESPDGPGGAGPQARDLDGSSAGHSDQPAEPNAAPVPPIEAGWNAPPAPPVLPVPPMSAAPPAPLGVGDWRAPEPPAPAAAPMVPVSAAPEFAPPAAPADPFYPPPQSATAAEPAPPAPPVSEPPEPAAPEPAAPEPAAPAPAAPEPASAETAFPEPAAPEPVVPAPVAGPPMVAAVTCVYGHLSPPYATECRVCSAAISPQEPFQTQRPVLGVLNLSTGDVVTLDRDVVLGRAPNHPGSDPNGQPHLVRLSSPDNDISRNHLRVHLDGWHILVTDLDSTNGTVATLPGQQPLRLRSNDALAIVPGTVVSIADEVSFRYEVPA